MTARRDSANGRANARLTFDYVVSDRLQDMVNANLEFYKRVTDDSAFGQYLLDRLFGRLLKGLKGA